MSAGHYILTLSVRKGQPQPVPRSRTHLIGALRGLFRCLAIQAEGEEIVSKKGTHCRYVNSRALFGPGVLCSATLGTGQMRSADVSYDEAGDRVKPVSSQLFQLPLGA